MSLSGVYVECGLRIWRKASLITKQNKYATRGAQLVPIAIPTSCLYNLEPNLINILSES